MSERVSDGLLVELQRKLDDETPRGLLWPLVAGLLVGVAPLASTPEDVAMANEALLAAIGSADDCAFRELELQAHVAQLKAYLDRGGRRP